MDRPGEVVTFSPETDPPPLLSVGMRVPCVSPYLLRCCLDVQVAAFAGREDPSGSLHGGLRSPVGCSGSEWRDRPDRPTRGGPARWNHNARPGGALPLSCPSPSRPSWRWDRRARSPTPVLRALTTRRRAT